MKPTWIVWVTLGIGLCSESLFAAPNVIMITLDGVRFEEMFWKKRLIPKLSKLVKTGQALSYRKVKIANPTGISLPGYISILSGNYERTCGKNTCKNTTHSTFFDGLIDNHAFDPKDLATIASWSNIGSAIELNPGRIYRDIGVQEEDANDLPPWGGSRWDFRTYDHALKYIEEKKPRALFLSFVDTDEYAHQHRFKKYVEAIRDFDTRLDHLLERLKAMGEYGDETSVVITTDHGRGHWFLYSIHGSSWGGAGHAWAFVIPSPKLLRDGKVKKLRRAKYSHTQIRPTLEVLMGLKPLKGTPLIRL